MAEKRTFESGATRDTDKGKPDYEGFLSPLVIKAFGEYMDAHRTMADGSVRDSDNWMKGIPFKSYMKSMWRHFYDVWSLHRGYKTTDHTGKVITKKEALLALLFNVQGYLHELLKEPNTHLIIPDGYVPIEGEPGSAVRVDDISDVEMIDGQAYYKAKSAFDGDWNQTDQSPGFWRIKGQGVTFIGHNKRNIPTSLSFGEAVMKIQSGEFVKNKWKDKV